jgi:hypothetical protein
VHLSVRRLSLKQDAAEDLLPEQLSAAKRWRSEVIAIATEEMLHLHS